MSLAQSRATKWSQLRSDGWKCVCVSVFSAFIILAISTWLIFTLTSSLFICWWLSVAGIDCLSSQANIRCGTKNAYGRNMKRSRVAFWIRNMWAWVLRTQEICWCPCLPKSVQYASLNHKVTTKWHNTSALSSLHKYVLPRVVYSRTLALWSLAFSNKIKFLTIPQYTLCNIYLYLCIIVVLLLFPASALPVRVAI